MFRLQKRLRGLSVSTLTNLAVLLAGSIRRELRDDWHAHLAGESGHAPITWRRNTEAFGFVASAVRFRLADAADVAWRPADVVLGLRTLSNLFVWGPVTVVFFAIVPDVRRPTRHLRGGRGAGRTVLPMTAEEIRAAGRMAVTPARRLAIALAAVHAARPRAIRELTLDDIDLPGRRITLAGHRQRLGELTRDALLAWLGYRRAAWPDTASRHVLVSRISALGTGLTRLPPASTSCAASAANASGATASCRNPLAAGADPLHLTLVFSIDHTNAMAYANAARNLLSSPAEQALSRRSRQARGHA